MSRTIIGTVICFALGLALGSLAPFVATLGQNSVLARLLIDTWRRYLFDEGWWMWSLGGGLMLAAPYLGIARLAARRAEGAVSQDRDASH